MIVINHVSMVLSVCVLVAAIVVWAHVRNGKSGSERRLVLLLLYLFGSMASVFASALSIAIVRFWIYPFTLGLAIFALIYIDLKVKQWWGD